MQGRCCSIRSLVLFFAFMLFYSLADSTVNDRKESELENRTLAQKPP